MFLNLITLNSVLYVKYQDLIKFINIFVSIAQYMSKYQTVFCTCTWGVSKHYFSNVYISIYLYSSSKIVTLRLERAWLMKQVWSGIWILGLIPNYVGVLGLVIFLSILVNQGGSELVYSSWWSVHKNAHKGLVQSQMWFLLLNTLFKLGGGGTSL